MRTHGAKKQLALILSLRYVARIQTRLNSCDSSDKILSQRSDNDFHMPNEAICCSNLSRRRVAAICRIVCLGLLLAAASKVLDGKFVALFEANHGAVRTCAVACWCNGGVLCGRRLFCQDT